MKTLFHLILSAIIWLIATGSIAAQCYNSNIRITDTIVTLPCNQNGQVDIGVSGGTAPYTFAWSGIAGGTVISTTQNLTNADGGAYIVTVTDANGHCAQSYIFVPTPFQSQASTTPDHCPLHDGTATVSATGGSIPYTYLWSNGATTATITNLRAGPYDVTITDANGCRVIMNRSDSSSLYVYSQDSIFVGVNTVNANCVDSTGSATATITGNGTAPYTYAWSSQWNGTPNPAWTTATINNLAGNIYYVVTVTDANGCMGNNYGYVGFTTPINLSTTSTNDDCNRSDGTATAIANGTTGPYTYLWSTGGTTAAITGLATGSYTVTVHDAGTCVNISSTYVNYYSPVYANPVQTDQICHGALGTATVTPTLGTTPYSYLWSNGASTATQNNLAAGSYYVTITDNLGCTAFASFYINYTSGIVANETHTDQVCNGAMGTAALNPIGGTSPYSFTWSTGQTTAAVNNLVSGYYYYTITDANGCQNSSNYVFINYNSTLSGYTTSLANATCQAHDGSASAVISGGTTPYSYLWSNGGNNATISNVGGGDYTVTVTDANNCSVQKWVQIIATSPMVATLNVTPATCIFTNDGSATVSIGGGTPPYTYQWGNGTSGTSVDSLNAQWGIGIYVTDVNGCWAENYQNAVGYSNLSCAAFIYGRVVDDVNANCIEDAGDGILQSTYVSCVPGYDALTSATGDFGIVVPAGNYALTQYAQYRNQGCPTGSIILNGCTAGQTYGSNKFYDWPLNVNDLRVSFDDWTEPRPGFNHTIKLFYYNDGLFPASGQIDFVYDTLVTYVSGGSSVNATTHTVTCTFGTTAPNGGWGEFDLIFNTPATVPLGTLESYSALITPVINDATPPNNSESAQYAVVSSYDPNGLVVSPKGTGLPGFITRNDSVLKYIIHFQNTGNFDASFVAIRDTLTGNLDLSTLKRGTSSSSYTWQLQNGNVLVFLMDPINLPDSAHDRVNSVGEVSFYIKQKKNLAGGAQVPNKAAIYFDFNRPVPTNSTLNTITGPVGIEEISDFMEIRLFPNPSSGNTNLVVDLKQDFKGDISVMNLMGQELMKKTADLQSGQHAITLETQQMSSGVYFVRISNSGISKSLSFIKQ